MSSLNQMFDEFAIAYQHSLYVIEQTENRAKTARRQAREAIKRSYEKEHSKSATISSNNLMATLHKLKDVCQKLNNLDDTVLRVAEYLSYGKLQPENIEQLLFTENSIPCIIPFFGHGNVLLESTGSECYAIGLQFALQALKQTAPGQLDVVVINPELRPEFFAFARLPGFKMLTKQSEVMDTLSSLTTELLECDSLLQGRYPSLVSLRKAAQQPIGRLKLIIIQDMPKETEDFENQFLRIAKGAPRAGIAIIVMRSKKSSKNDVTINTIRKIDSFSSYIYSNGKWHSQSLEYENLIYDFPVQSADEIAGDISSLIEESNKTKVVTIPFEQIKEETVKWSRNASEHLIFNLGKSGLDTVSVCIGDKVTQYHNILISGAVGKGKSNLLEVMIHSLCFAYSPSELELYLLDFKDGLTFKPYSERNDRSWLPHAKMLGLESNRDVGLAVLRDIEAERLRRAELFRDAPNGGAQNYEDYRKKFPDCSISRIVLVIDEYQKLFEVNDDISEKSSALLENLVRQGRACAIHIVLASQTINGAAGLLGKEDRIYGQFPVRIALQNTLAESYALFGIGNDGAAQLRVRGEAIINVNYGAIDSNQRFTVAYAAPDEMKILRQEFCKNCSAELFPVIFTRDDRMEFSLIFANVKEWRKTALEAKIAYVPIGIKLSVTKNVISIPFTNESGKNIAILGAAEDLRRKDALPGKNHMALGMVQGMAISLALQHPDGNARFVLVDGLAEDVKKNSNTQRWLKLMERFGFPVETVSADEATTWLIDYLHDVSNVSPEEDTYLMCVGMDRYSDFSEMTLSGESGADAFQQLLKFGTKGVHFICWWTNANVYKTHIGFSGDGYFGTKVLLRTDTDTARDVLGPFVSWSVRDNRAYVHDTSELQEDEVVIPLMPISDRICGLIEAEEW